MNISIKDMDDAVVVRLVGSLDSNTAPDAETKFLDLIGAGRTKVVVDLEKLDYISSAGLRVLLVAAKKLGAGGGKLRLCALNEFVREVFDCSGFSTILQVFEREEDALRGF